MVLIEIDNDKVEKNYCIMSEEPIKFGVGIKITEPIWTKIKKEKKFLFDKNEAYVTEEIDIGDSTWFIFELKDKKKAKKYL